MLKFFRLKIFLKIFRSRIFQLSLVKSLSLGLILFYPIASLHSSLPPPPLKIAIIDTGADLQHESIQAYIWKNTGELGVDSEGRSKNSNQLDDDNNGYVDDIHGYNFANGSSDLTDTNGHGTHIAGLIVSKAAEGRQRFELMILKYYDDDMSQEEQRKSFIKALRYAVDNKADIINISAGGTYFNHEEWDILRQAKEQGTIIVAAAGNKKVNDENRLFYPAAYNLENIVSVVATNKEGNVLTTSNENLNKKNIYVLGEKVYSSLPNNTYGYKTGSSQAAALMTGYLIASYKDSINLANVSITSKTFHSTFK